MHATATSGVITLSHTERFEAERRMPSVIQVHFVIPQRGGIVGKLREMVEQLEADIRAHYRERGFTGRLEFRLVDAATQDLTTDGFRHLLTRDGNDERGRPVSVAAYGKSIYDGNRPKPGVLHAQVRLRAKVCVEANETHLTFEPEARPHVSPELPPTANIPQPALAQKVKEFEARVEQEVARSVEALRRRREPLSEHQRGQIRTVAVEFFDIQVPVPFFDETFPLPVRVTPLKTPRICGRPGG